MAQLKDLIVTGATRLIGDAFVNKIQITSISAPTSAGGTSYSLGTNGYVLKTNGSSVYWAADSNSVTGVKGNAESSYRTGDINLTPANIGAATSDHNHDSTYLKLSGGTMTGGINLVGNQSSAWNDKGLIYTKGSRIGENTNGDLGLYGYGKIYLRPSATTASGSEGIEISSTGLVPTNNNSENLGGSSNKWSNVYATTFNGALSGNATTATTLETARTIWGQSFNGTANISGNLIDAGPQIKLPSGQTIFSFLKSDNTAPSAAFGRLGLADTYSDINLTDFRFDVHGNGRFTRSLQAGETDTTDEQQIDLYGPAGLIYMYSQASTTGDRGLYGRNSEGTYGNIFSIDQLNNTAFFGNHLLQLHTNGTRKQEIDDCHTTVWSSQVGANAFGGSAIEIRETNLVGNTQSSMEYAPKLGFHWSGRAAGFLGLNQSSQFELKAMDNSGYMGLNVYGLTAYDGAISVQLRNVDASLANNNISSTIYPTSFNILDSANRIMCRSEAVIFPGGTIRGYWYVRNYNTSGGQVVQKGIHIDANKDGSFSAGCDSPFYGAVWNDYAEYRESNITEPGRCIRETGNGDLVLTTKRLEKGCEIISDTFGFAIGQSDVCKTPTAATGRVLAYLLEPIEEAKKNIGQAVCSGPNGTVSIMTDEECRLWPQCIIGTISEIPDYEIWHAGTQEGNKFEEIQVNGRIWIRIR